VPGTMQSSTDDQVLTRRIRRELKTVRVMIALYCGAHHRDADRHALCDACDELWRYVEKRVQHCPFRAEKPTCVNCEVHCFKPAMRERVRQVMRYAGPRMSWRHPLLALMHFVDGRKPAPSRER